MIKYIYILLALRASLLGGSWTLGWFVFWVTNLAEGLGFWQIIFFSH